MYEQQIRAIFGDDPDNWPATDIDHQIETISVWLCAMKLKTFDPGTISLVLGLKMKTVEETLEIFTEIGATPELVASEYNSAEDKSTILTMWILVMGYQLQMMVDGGQLKFYSPQQVN